MKPTFYFILLIFIYTFSINAQITTASRNWIAIGDTNLNIVTSDGDNGDGVADGALFVDGQTTVVGQGAFHTFGGTMSLENTCNKILPN